MVESTTADYFVLYASHDVGGTTVEYPVRVVLGEDGTTTLSENVAPLPKDRYRVQKYSIEEPADVDGDCTDDITELGNLGPMNPVNAAPSIDLSDGAVALPDRRLSRNSPILTPAEHGTSSSSYSTMTPTGPGSTSRTLEMRCTMGPSWIPSASIGAKKTLSPELSFLTRVSWPKMAVVGFIASSPAAHMVVPTVSSSALTLSSRPMCRS